MEAEKSDERILGNGDFVEKIMAETEERQNRLLTGVSASRKVEETIGSMCDDEGVRVTELKGGSRRGQICRIRKRIAQELIERYGIRMAIVVVKPAFPPQLFQR